ncbi:MAG TPA: hypothetical protein VI916_14020, partial [Acidimicrobiia bacterium]|nr:hypothetical protein [Acidimicrobiia bacterium]
MLRKTLVAAALVGLVAGIAPIRAEATPNDTRAVLVFAGSARVGNGAWTSSTEPAVGNGLCFPGLTPTAGDPTATPPVAPTCSTTDDNADGDGDSLTGIANSWSFKVPESIDGLPTACVSEGTLGGNNASDGACSFLLDGYVDENAA